MRTPDKTEQRTLRHRIRRSLRDHQTSWRMLFGAAITGAVATALFASVLSFEFVTYDDPAHITRNPLLDPLSSHLSSIWTAPYEGLFIPVAYTVWGGLMALSRALPGPPVHANPAVFHAASLLLHGINALLVFFLLKRWVKTSTAATLGALLFAVHPLQIEAVAWSSELRGLLASAFALTALHVHLETLKRRLPKEGSNRNGLVAGIGASCVLYVLALLAKPAAVVLPVILLVLLICLTRTPRRRALTSVLPHILVTVPYALITRLAQPAGEAGFTPNPLARLLVAADAVRFYAFKLFLPVDLAPDYGQTPARVLLSDGAVWWAFLTLAILVPGAVLVRRDRRTVAVPALFLAALLPVLGLIPFSFQATSTVADRYAYLALIGPALGLAFLMDQERGIGPVRTLALGIVVLFSALTIQQLPVWRNSPALYRHALSVNPRSALCHNNLGVWFLEQEDPVSALPHLFRAMELDPYDSDPVCNLASAFFENGQTEYAVDFLEETVLRHPASAEWHNNLGLAYLRAGRSDHAKKAFRRAVSCDPDYFPASQNLGTLLLERGAAEKAVQVFGHAIQLNPARASAWLGAGKALAELQQWDKAVHCLRSAVEHEPDNARARYLLANAVMRLEGPEEALEHYREACRLQPNAARFRHNMSVALEKTGRQEEAFEELKKAHVLEPDLAHVFLYRQAQIRHRQKRWRDAIELYLRALVRAPDMQEARDALERLRRDVKAEGARMTDANGTDQR